MTAGLEGKSVEILEEKTLAVVEAEEFVRNYFHVDWLPL